jgi:hypothetical protein
MAKIETCRSVFGLLRMNPPSEYEHALQAQLLTGVGKPRTWFATKAGCQYVVKGPVSEEEQGACLRSQAVKELLGMPHTGMRAEGSFLIQQCLFDYTQYPTEIRGSRLESKRPILSPSTNMSWRHEYVKTASYAVIQQLMETLLFRRIILTNDTCPQNILFVDGIIYSIDDGAYNKHPRQMWKRPLCPQERQDYLDALQHVWEPLQATMKHWYTLLEGEPALQKRLLKFKHFRHWVF